LDLVKSRLQKGNIQQNKGIWSKETKEEDSRQKNLFHLLVQSNGEPIPHNFRLERLLADKVCNICFLELAPDKMMTDILLSRSHFPS